MFKIAKRAAKWLIVDVPTLIFDRPLPPPSSEEVELIAEFRAEISKFTREVQNSSNVTDLWKENVLRFESAVKNRDPREFLRWDECLPLRAGPTVFPQFFALRSSPDWRNRWQPALEDGPVGHPQPFFLYPKVGGNIILHAHHYHVFENFCGLKIADFGTVIEFGGGFGGLCRLTRKLGFEGRYVIFDLPQQSLLQRFYLKSSKFKITALNDAEKVVDGTFLENDLEQLQHKLPLLKEKSKGPTLFVANWSLSECPIALRDEVTKSIIDKCDFFLITYQERFQDIDNRTYFQN